MLVIGLTGSIGMGKTTVAEHLQAQGIPVLNADQEVHKLYAGAAAPLIEKAFPGSTENDVVDRQKLSRQLLENPSGFKVLENIVHPMVRAIERDFLKSHAQQGTLMAVLEIPLLFETGGDDLVDLTIVVSASEEIQRARVKDRPGMSDQKLYEILSRQMPDREKKERAHFVVDTCGTIDQTRAKIDKIVASISANQGNAFQRHWK